MNNLIWQMHTKKADFDEFKSIYSDILKLFMMKWGDRDNTIISLKMSGYSHYFIKFIFQMFPDSNDIYLTRYPVDIAISLENFAQSRVGFSLPYIKRELSSYSDLDYYHHDMIENREYGRYINKYFHLTNKQKKKYSLFAERAKIILNSLEQKSIA